MERLLDKILEQFLAIAEAGSYMAAAENLLVSQPALTYNIKKLEQSLNVPLFERSTRGVRLTPYGEILYDDAVIMRRLHANTLEKIDRRRAEVEQGLSIGTGYSTWHLFLKDMLFDHFKRHTNAPINVSLGNALRCMDQLLAGDISLFVGHRIANLTHDADINFLPLGMTRDGYFVRTEHPLLGEKRRKAEVMAYPTTIAFPAEARHKRLVSMGTGVQPDLPPNGFGHSFTSSSLDACVEFASMMDGVLIHNDRLASFLAGKGLAQVEMFEEEQPAPWPLGIYVLTERMTDPAVNTLITLLLENASRMTRVDAL
jgi:DNA-binding transcriptional LysR family regulator